MNTVKETFTLIFFSMVKKNLPNHLMCFRQLMEHLYDFLRKRKKFVLKMLDSSRSNDKRVWQRKETSDGVKLLRERGKRS